MLQQTQVATVRDRFYAPFLAKFPSVAALAAAPEAAVMKAWEGLGYYSRARNLRAAAQQIVSSGMWQVTGDSPTTCHPSLATLLSLPGIGRNTASAILAFAYHQPIAILEANVKRVVARVFALETPTDEQLWAGAEMLLNQAAPFDYNQAMMDLGSMICTPKNPNCDACPTASLCAGKTAPLRYPTRKIKKAIPTRHVTISVREDARGRLFLEPRDAKLLGGLWGFPQVTSLQSPVSSKKAKADSLSLRTEDWRLTTTSLGTVTHIYSHFKLIGEVVYEKQTTVSNSPDWHTREEIAALPLSTLDHKVLALVEKRHSPQNKPRKKGAARSKN